MEGDARVMTFPIPTINLTKFFDWDNENFKRVMRNDRQVRHSVFLKLD